MTEILAEILRLDDAGRSHEIIDHLLRQSTEGMMLLVGLKHLLENQRFVAASHLATVMLRIWSDHPLVQFACAIGGLVTNDRTVEVESTATLAKICDALSTEQRSYFYTNMLDPTMRHVVAPALGSDDHVTLMRGLEILKAGSPALRQIFDWSTTTRPLPAISGQCESLITYRSPPQGAPRGARRTVVAVRERFPENAPPSRLFDVGPRFVDAASRYGWPAIFCPLSWNPWRPSLAIDARRIIDCCRDFDADVLILDDHFIVSETTHVLRRQMIAELRQVLPSIRIMALHLDSWHIVPDLMRRTAPDVDALWAATPSMPHWQDPVFAGKLLQAPLVHSGNLRLPDPVASNHISFVGGLMNYNWHRVFWRAAALKDGLPIDWQLSTHADDGLPALDGYAGYMRRLAESGCSLNFAMRGDLSYVITDRAFEAPIVGTLLIQEAAPDLDYFFVAGEHYLAFKTYADLRAVVELVQTQPETVRAIRQAGHEFAVARYADEKLIGYLDAILFHPLPA